MIKQIDSLQSGGSLRTATFHYTPYYFGGLEFFAIFVVTHISDHYEQ